MFSARATLAFRTLKYLSFTHSAIYAGLLSVWLWFPNANQARFILGMSHGIGWIGISLLVIWAVRARVLPLWLGLGVAVIGGLGPFAGSIGFVVEERNRRIRKRAKRSSAPTRERVASASS